MLEVGQVKRNTILFFLQFGAVAAVALFTSPVLVSAMGAATFGLWKTLQRLFEVLSLLDGRPGQTLKLLLPKVRTHTEDGAKTARIITEQASRRWRRHLPVFVACSTGVSAFVLLRAEHRVLETGLFCIMLTSSLIVASRWSIEDAVLTAANESWRSSAVQICSQILLLVLLLVASRAEWPLLGVGLAALATSIVTNAALSWVARRKIFWLNLDPNIGTGSSDFQSTSRWALGWSIAERSILALDVLAIAWFCGTESAGVYTFNAYVYQMGLSFALLSASALTPPLSRAISEGNVEKTEIYLNRIYKRTAVMIAVFCILIVAINRTFVELWVGQKYIMSWGGTLLIALLFFQLSQSRRDGQILDALNSLKEKTVAGAVSVLALPLAIFAAQHLGVRIAIETILFAIIGIRLLPCMYINWKVRQKLCRKIDAGVLVSPLLQLLSLIAIAKLAGIL